MKLVTLGEDRFVCVQRTGAIVRVEAPMNLESAKWAAFYTREHGGTASVFELVPIPEQAESEQETLAKWFETVLEELPEEEESNPRGGSTSTA